ncbi:hypothetical protein YC2023_081379 [Brassica napus]
MKAIRGWRLGRTSHMPGAHHRARTEKPVWIIAVVSLIIMFVIGAYMFPHHSKAACYMLSSKGCKGLTDWLPTSPRKFSYDEITARVVTREVLSSPLVIKKSSKIAFMFLTPGTLPFEKLWDLFFRGHEGKLSVYIHASKDTPVHTSRYFINRDIPSDEVVWGTISMIDAERRLLANALRDPENQQFVLLSDSFYDPGRHGTGRHTDHMLPEIPKEDFRKGSQWFSIKRQHAVITAADSLYYSKFRDYCGVSNDLAIKIDPGVESNKYCIADEHYLPTLFHMLDPGGIANWTLTYVDWSEKKWHPKTYMPEDITHELLMNLMGVVTWTQCMWNGIKRPCYLFGRKFHAHTLDKLIDVFSNYTTILHKPH